MNFMRMTRVVKLNFIKNKVQFSKFHSSNILAGSATAFDYPYSVLPTEFRESIYYSSYLEDQKPKLGFKRKKIQESILKNKQYRLKLKNSNVKTFPSALKTFDELKELDVKTHSTPNAVGIPKETFSISTIKQQKIAVPIRGNWMEDYEFYEGCESPSSVYGTQDPSEPPSKIPCNGCGGHLQCADPGLPGYIPGEIFKGRTKDELKLIICQRCHFLENYNVAIDVTIPPETYIETISSIKDKYALAILIVDLLDFPCSIWPNIQQILGEKRPVFIVGNKVDLLPQDSKGYLDHIKNCLKHEIMKSGLTEMNIQNVSLISAKTGYGVEELITQLHKVWGFRGDVYLVGCANVGKSSLFNALLRSDYCKVEASDLIQKATTCPWPGTTIQMLKFPILRPSDFRIFQRCKRLFSERAQQQAEAKLRRDQLKKTGKVELATLIGHIGRTFENHEEKLDMFSMNKGTKSILTLDENGKKYLNSKWCYDTPGVMQPEQIHSLLTTEELLISTPTETLVPRVFRIMPYSTLFLSGLGRLDFLYSEIDSIRISVYASSKLPVLICKTSSAHDVYKHFLGSQLLAIPQGDEERLKRWPQLASSDDIHIIGKKTAGATCDILLSSAGWIGINIPTDKKCIFKAWTPEKRGIVVRHPSLIQFGENLRGQKIRGSLAYRIGNP